MSPNPPRAKNSPPNPGERLLFLTLAIEAAAASANWEEFQALTQARAAEIDNLSVLEAALTPETTDRVQAAQERVIKSLRSRKQRIAQDLAKLAQFRKTVSASLALTDHR